ncbi:MAG TPA: EthD family reductase [Afipia sp.]|uniref:EthD family reductase n=1 Tax=unclassified Afipia TaxID=2642050 RepID=UPI000464A733|nr:MULTISPECIES: EthD family reductase [unclassified Afipia]MAH71548.1 EthD family reductase [Afipia sp.]OUX59389.1 MAG: ethyl tert-butyl ether degradation protein EthD [Afipia sp. TMED4]HAO42738.1 EthD family reductase [Afipia sp.]HAP11559.1 EthD family reductase [Afipia sp.]HAP48564.1 EthD family reductase [Afipia sp.]|tara:strand:- start:471 stop:776 length:306 start_codon:yes stop_codon:yes gene_type:complete
MILVTVMYPAGEAFDTDYYLKTHMPLVKDRWGPLGLKSAQAIKGVAKPDGSAPDFQMTALLTFGSMEDFKAAGKAHGKEIFADIPNFTKAQAVVQINDVVF